MLYEKRFQQDAIPCISIPVPVKTAPASFNELDKTPDQLLWDAFKKGDERAFVRIYKSYAKMLFHYGCKFTPDKEMVRDCLHDFFIYLRNNKAGFGDISSIKQYLFKAFRRRVVHYLKQVANQPTVTELSDFSKYAVEQSFESVYINQQIKAERLEKLNNALKALDQKERIAIYYFYYQGLSYEQIAAIFKFSHVSSARRVMYRGLRQLRDLFSYS